MVKARKLSPKKTFAIAYRIFTTLDDKPKRSAEYAERLSISICAVKSVVKILSRLDCIVTKRGGGKESGIRRLPGVTVKDLFTRFNVQYKQGNEFEQEVDALISKGFSRPKTCTICKKKTTVLNEDWLCNHCVSLCVPIQESKRLAKCGHYSVARYFNCEACKPELDDNTTPDDFGYGVSLLS